MKHINGDLVKAFEDSDINMLVHQVNCQGKMGSGIAKQIKEFCPQHYDDYKDATFNVQPLRLLSDYVYTEHENKSILGIFTQLNYGYDGQLYTSYAALSLALYEIASAYNGHKIGIPYGLGCGLGGGDWKIVESILLDVEKITGIEFYCYRL